MFQFGFVPCSEVTLGDGVTKKRIDQISNLDFVSTWVSGTEFQACRVSAIVHLICTELLRVQMDMGTIYCHPDQSILKGYKWVKAHELLPDMNISSVSPHYGQHLRKVSYVTRLTPAEIRAYNTSPDDLQLYSLALEEPGNYIVNNTMVLDCHVGATIG